MRDHPIVQTIESVVVHPLLWVVITLLLAAAAFSGRLSVTAADICIVIAWLTGAFGIYRIVLYFGWSPVPRALTTLILASALGLAFWGFAQWLGSPQLPTPAGGDVPKKTKNEPPPADRPIVLIEELEPALLRAMAMADPHNVVQSEGSYVRGYAFGKAPNAEEILYNVRNVSNAVARRMEYRAKVWTIDAAGKESVVPSVLPPATAEVLLPGQYITRHLVLPSGTVFTGEAKATGQVKIELTVRYSGLSSDYRRYYYTVILRSKRFQGPNAMTRQGLFGLKLESADEGIAKD